MGKHIIEVAGCEDTTAVPMEVTDAELATIMRLADMVDAARTSGCKPVIVVDPGYYTWDLTVADYQEYVAEKRENEKENAS